MRSSLVPSDPGETGANLTVFLTLSTIPSLSDRILGRSTRQARRDVLARPQELDFPSTPSSSSFDIQTPLTPTAPSSFSSPPSSSTSARSWRKSKSKPKTPKPQKYRGGMIVISLVRPTGNSSPGEFPYAGRFGIDDVRVYGRVKTGVDERASGKPPPVCNLVVRVIKKESTPAGKRDVVVAEKLLWTPPDGAKTAILGEQDLKFDLVVPPTTPGICGGPSLAMYAMDTRTNWRVEACAFSRLLPQNRTLTRSS